MTLGRTMPHGALAVVNEDGPTCNWFRSPTSPPRSTSQPARGKIRALPLARGPFAAIPATVETAPSIVSAMADDPAIWAHPSDPALSIVIGTDKREGLNVYDMQGREIQRLSDGKMNNVDLRDNFSLGGQRITIVAASNRTDRGIALYRLDPQTRQLINVADGVQPSGLNDPYGLCMYQNPQSGRTYVFVNGDDTRMRQFELRAQNNGRVRAQFVREITFGSQTEGCVADDAAQTLFVGEEDIGIWRVGAEPDASTALISVDTIESNPALRDDVEGMAIYDLGDGRGYIVVSSQGNNSYAVYRREGAREYLGSFIVSADPAANIDGASETDGLDVSSANLGPGFEHGAVVVQDGRNVMPEQRQNFKYVPWSAIAAALNLEVRR